jgi:hypothetical protein
VKKKVWKNFQKYFGNFSSKQNILGVSSVKFCGGKILCKKKKYFGNFSSKQNILGFSSVKFCGGRILWKKKKFWQF